jgi:hypothetical protein
MPLSGAPICFRFEAYKSIRNVECGILDLSASILQNLGLKFLGTDLFTSIFLKSHRCLTNGTDEKMARVKRTLPKRKSQPKAFLQRSLGLQKKGYALGKVCSDVKVCVFIERDGELHSSQSHRGWPISPQDIGSEDFDPRFQKGPEHFETVAEMRAVSTTSTIAIAHPQPQRFCGPGLVEIIDPGACESSKASQVTHCVS